MHVKQICTLLYGLFTPFSTNLTTTSNCFLNNFINRLVCITRIHCVLCKIETGVLCIILMSANVHDCAMGHRVSHRSLAAEGQVQSQVSSCETYGGPTSHDTRLYPGTSTFSWRFHLHQCSIFVLILMLLFLSDKQPGDA